MEEKELVKASITGDDEAFSQLVRKYKTKVYNMALSFAKEPNIADDLAQEIFIKSYFALPRFAYKSEFGTWLYRIAINHIKDYLRKKTRTREISLDQVKEPSIMPEDEILSAEKELDEEQKRVILHKLIDTLPEKSRLIISLRDIQGLSYKEISGVLNISMGTADSRLFRARKKLRERLTVYLNEKGGKNGL